MAVVFNGTAVVCPTTKGRGGPRTGCGSTNVHQAASAFAFACDDCGLSFDAVDVTVDRSVVRPGMTERQVRDSDRWHRDGRS